MNNSTFDITQVAQIRQAGNRQYNTLTIELEMSEGEAMDAVREIVGNLGGKDREALLAELADDLIERAKDAGIEEGRALGLED